MPPISGSSTAATTKSSSVSDSPATAASTEPCRPRSAEPPRHARGADHPGGIDARHQAGALRRACHLALLERAAVGRQQPHAHLEMPRPALGKGVDRLEQHLHALGRHGFGDARELGIERAAARLAARRLGLGVRSRAGAIVGHQDGAPPADGVCGVWSGAARECACGPGTVRAVACKAATECPIMASVALAGMGLPALRGGRSCC